MTIKELKDALDEWPDDCPVEILTAKGDRNVTGEIWLVGRLTLYADKEPVIVYICG